MSAKILLLGLIDNIYLMIRKDRLFIDRGKRAITCFILRIFKEF